jgi:hypothetical protein
MTNPGDRLQLVRLAAPHEILHEGSLGRVIWVGGDGLVHVTWDEPYVLDVEVGETKATLALTPGQDEWLIVDERG